MIVEHGLTEHSLPDDWHHLDGVCTKEKFAPQVNADISLNLLDSLVLLANQDKFMEVMDKINILALLERLKIKPFGESRTKVDVINGMIGAWKMGDDKNLMPVEEGAEELD